MAYRQHTSCVQPINYVPIGFTGYAFLVGILTSIIVAVSMAYNILAIPILIGLLVILISLLIWWLYGRLICLGGEKCAIGVVTGITIPPVSIFKKAGDDDYTINLLMAPGPLTKNEDVSLYENALQGELLKKQASVLTIGRGYAEDSNEHRKALHCEFEGDGILNVLEWASVLLALLILALAVPFLSWLFIILAYLVSAFTLYIWANPQNPGNATDIDPVLANLKKGSIVVIKGDWIYDSFHDGWNELHPVKNCQIIGEVVNIDKDQTEWQWPADPLGLALDTDEHVKQAIDQWCAALKDADNAETGGNRGDPENQWTVHPLVDGCKKPVIIT